MKKVVCLENSPILSKTINSELNNIKLKVKCYSGAIEGITKIHQDPPDLIVISSLLNDLRGTDVLEYLKYEKELKSIPVIIYSTVTNNCNSIFFEKANYFIKKDLDFKKNLIKSVRKILESNTFIEVAPRNVSRIEILSTIDKIYTQRDTLNLIILDILEKVFNITEKDKTIKNALEILGNNFSISSVKYSNVDSCEIKEFPTPKEVVSLIQNINIENNNNKFEIQHFIDNNEELENFNYIANTLLKAIELSEIYNENLYYAIKLNYLFKNFLPEKVVDDLISRKSQKSLMTGEKREVAVIFSHIKGFNDIKEKLNAQEVVDFLNNHFSGLSTKIKETGGEINKFIGDAVFAMVGAPLSFNDNEERAIKAAKGIIDFVNNSEREYKVGVGIHIGKAIIGNIGSEDNFDYTAIGDTINLAARLESLCKYYQVNILVSDAIYKACIKKDSLIEFREIDTVMVQGKDEPTTIYSVEPLFIYPDKYIHTYNKGLKMFKLGNWNFALEYFHRCQKELKNDRIVDIYTERCKKFLITPPTNWSGSIILDFK